MSLTLSDFKASTRRRAILLPTRPVVDSTPPEVPAVETALSIRQRMEQRNPALSTLIAALDLEEVSFSVPAEPAPVEAAQPRRADPKRLATIAQTTFLPNTSYSADEATDLISTKTGLSTERAANGLTLMVGQSLLTVHNGIYYRTDSTPF